MSQNYKKICKAGKKAVPKAIEKGVVRNGGYFKTDYVGLWLLHVLQAG